MGCPQMWQGSRLNRSAAVILRHGLPALPLLRGITISSAVVADGSAAGLAAFTADVHRSDIS